MLTKGAGRRGAQGRPPAEALASTISRELRRNAATRPGSSGYRAVNAQWHAGRRARRPKTAKLVANTKLRDYVQDRLSGEVARPDGTLVAGPTVRFKGRRHGPRQDRRWAKAWSPKQISNRLRVDFPDDETMRTSAEAIYQPLFIQGRGALKRELVACLRTGRALRVPRARAAGRGKNYVTPEVLVSERPAEGKNDKEILRCLKRYIAREIFRLLTNPPSVPDGTHLRARRAVVGATLATVATHLGTTPVRIPRLERGVLHCAELASAYRSWLNNETSHLAA